MINKTRPFIFLSNSEQMRYWQWLQLRYGWSQLQATIWFTQILLQLLIKSLTSG